MTTKWDSFEAAANIHIDDEAESMIKLMTDRKGNKSQYFLCQYHETTILHAVVT